MNDESAKKDNAHFGKIVLKKDTEDGMMTVIDCKRCGFMHQNPIPSEEQMVHYYKKTYFKTERSKDYVKKQKEDEEYLELCNMEKEKKIRSLLDKGLPLKIVDIGCGGGSLLSLFKKEGWKVMGIEPSEELYKQVLKPNGINAFNGTFDEFMKNNHERFSVVNLTAVIEHLREPPELFSRINQELLVLGGILCVEVPNDFNILQKCTGNINKKEWWACYEHINYFSQKSLRKALEKEGFAVKYVTVTFPMELFILLGFNYVDQPELGKDMHERRVSFERRVSKSKKENALKEKLYRQFGKIGIGRTIVAYAKKTK